MIINPLTLRLQVGEDTRCAWLALPENKIRRLELYHSHLPNIFLYWTNKPQFTCIYIVLYNLVCRRMKWIFFYCFIQILIYYILAGLWYKSIFELEADRSIPLLMPVSPGPWPGVGGVVKRRAMSPHYYTTHILVEVAMCAINGLLFLV